MKYKNIAVAAGILFGILMSGCCMVNETVVEQKPTIEPDPTDCRNMDRALLESYSDLAIQGAIITQHTLYPYHFVNNSDRLNGLGERNLAILVEHFLENPGQLYLQQGDTDWQLYQMRSQTVHQKLLERGISEHKINITRGSARGQGIPSSVVVEILEVTKSPPRSDSSGVGIERTDRY